ncbi:hypothetical protein, partial [Pyramidobacter piscolens]|uniref:hypothetical protein n=1 Tax=Pyramidobacter piscolens TaxID=638849 RepID=UPI003AB695BB
LKCRTQGVAEEFSRSKTMLILSSKNQYKTENLFPAAADAPQTNAARFRSARFRRKKTRGMSSPGGFYPEQARDTETAWGEANEERLPLPFCRIFAERKNPANR